MKKVCTPSHEGRRGPVAGLGRPPEAVKRPVGDPAREPAVAARPGGPELGESRHPPAAREGDEADSKKQQKQGKVPHCNGSKASSKSLEEKMPIAEGGKRGEGF